MEKGIRKLIPIHDIGLQFCQNLAYFFTDIDDTLTEKGLLPSSSLAAIEGLTGAGIAVIPVTGRPAGWCDHIARMWPVHAVIGENGAFYFSYQRTQRIMRRVFSQECAEREGAGKKLEALTARLLKKFPGVGLASDQPFRMTDAAFDLCEDREPLAKDKIDSLCVFLTEQGAHYKISSIHLNVWYGDYDKKTCLFQFLDDIAETTSNPILDKCLFIGDSPNDEPLFAALPVTVAVANIQAYLNDLTHYPAYITKKPSAKGFSEAVNLILEKRFSKPQPLPL
jgi:HAD superfamily hydrolase (TIGR01484 family)